MPFRLVDTLAELDGTEQYHLAMAITDAMCVTAAVVATKATAGKVIAPHVGMLNELEQLREDVLIQSARITVPFRQAQAMIATVLFRRRHPVRVPGTR